MEGEPAALRVRGESARSARHPMLARNRPLGVMGFHRFGKCRGLGYQQPPRMPASPPLPSRTTKTLTLHDLLAAVAGIRGRRRRHGTRLELVCWDLDIEESLARPAWELALRTSLLEAADADRLTGKAMYVLSDGGRRAVGGSGSRRRGD